VYAQQIQKRYGGPEHLVVLGVDQHTFFDTLTGFIEAMDIQYPVLIDDYGMVSATYLVGFELEQFFFVVIDQVGVIRFRGNELKQEIFLVLDELMGRLAHQFVSLTSTPGSAVNGCFAALDCLRCCWTQSDCRPQTRPRLQNR
jgi:hypothetical protein